MCSSVRIALRSPSWVFRFRGSERQQSSAVERESLTNKQPKNVAETEQIPTHIGHIIALFTLLVLGTSIATCVRTL